MGSTHSTIVFCDFENTWKIMRCGKWFCKPLHDITRQICVISKYFEVCLLKTGSSSMGMQSSGSVCLLSFK